MNIVICDDCKEDIKFLKRLILASGQCPVDAKFYEFLSGVDLLENYQYYDIIFLDMQMEGMNGKETAEKIRELDSEVIISFYSGYEVSAHKILDSRPSKYILKGSNEEALIKDIDKVLLEAINKKHTMLLKVQYYGNMVILKLTDILYISINNKGSLIWITKEKAKELGIIDDKMSDNALKSAVTIKEYYEELKDYGFIYSSVSYLVNAENVSGRTTNSILLKGGCKVDLARRMSKKFDDEFGRFWNSKYNKGRLNE